MATAAQNQTAPTRAAQQAPTHEAAPKKKGVKGGPVLFWLVAGIAVAADIVDIFTSLLGLIGLALQVIPLIGNAAGIAIAALSAGISIVSGLFISFTMLTYFAYIGGGFARRLVLMSIGVIIEMIPGLEILPTTTAMFFLAYFIGKIKILQTVASKTSIGKKILHA
jgi:hypothetical protein